MVGNCYLNQKGKYMGLFDKLFKKESNIQTKEGVAASTQSTISTSNPCVIDMSKSAEHLNKVLIDMSKTSKIDMSKHVARVALAMDYSGSMDHLFSNGSVQKTITRLLPIALKFDDNGELESWLFSNGSERLEAVTIKNYQDYVKKVMKKADMYMGGTNYAPVLNEIITYYKDVEPSNIPAFIMFITDGDNFDEKETNRIVRELSNYNMFVQFVGIGNAGFDYLRKLDDLNGRKTDNTGFLAVSDMNKMNDEELYKNLLSQYKDWLNNK